MNDPDAQRNEKAMLLLRRERELLALRRKHEQVTSWLRLTQSLPDLVDGELALDAIYKRLQRALLGGLRLQRVAFFEIVGTSLRPIGNTGPERSLDAAVVAALEARRAGICNTPDEAPLGALGRLVGLHRFAWGRINALALAPVLLVAGFDEPNAAFREPFVAEDADYFGHLALHLGTLLGNALLLRQLEREKSKLEDFNETLQRKVEQRTRALSRANEELAAEMAARAKMEVELRQAQKLEAVGRLASGVAHEINTPIQFVSDSVQFAKDALADLSGLVVDYRAINAMVLTGTVTTEAARQVAEAEERADLDYLLANLPPALGRALDGLDRIATIVRSLKEFAHPDQHQKTTLDLNHAIVTTLTIARNEYKYVADVETDLAEIPNVTGHAGEVNQVLLNLIVNAAHAIGDVITGTDRGHIKVRTYVDAGAVVIAITDSGAGIPDEIRNRIFDPFFTTKAVGKGTGQGLAIARSVVVEKHGGSLTFESTLGRGTTFFVRLPIEAAVPAEAVA